MYFITRLSASSRLLHNNTIYNLSHVLSVQKFDKPNALENDVFRCDMLPYAVQVISTDSRGGFPHLGILLRHLPQKEGIAIAVNPRYAEHRGNHVARFSLKARVQFSLTGY